MKPIDPSALREIVSRFSEQRVTVVGDLIADVYLTAQTERISREAPVLVLRYQSEELLPGGAGNVVKNIVRLGGQAVPVGWVGDDAHGETLCARFREWGVDVSGIVTEPASATPSKTRIIAGDVNVLPRQVVRVDRGAEHALSRETVTRITEFAVAVSSHGAPTIVSDYGYFTISDTLWQRLAQTGCECIIDSRFRLASFAGAEWCLPNVPEAQQILGATGGGSADLLQMGRALSAALSIRHVGLTRGNQGIALFVDGELQVDYPAVGGNDVVDTTGAGDTVVAAVALALAAGAEPEQAIWIANLAAGISVCRSRNNCATQADLLAHIAAIS